MVAAYQLPERRPGCGARCTTRNVIVPGLLGRQAIALHDPDVHEEYGRVLAGDRTAGQIFEAGPLRLDRGQQRVWVGGVEARLTPTEWRLFLAIADGGGRLVTLHQVMLAVWGTTEGYNAHNVRVPLQRLRRGLGRAAALIETVVGQGYRFRMLAPGAPIPASWQTTNPSRGIWTTAYPCCRDCGRSDRENYGLGYCQTCHKRRFRSRGEAAR